MKFFLLDFLNRISCKKRNGVMLVNIFFKIFSQSFKIWVECPFKDRTLQMRSPSDLICGEQDRKKPSQISCLLFFAMAIAIFDVNFWYRKKPQTQNLRCFFKDPAHQLAT